MKQSVSRISLFYFYLSKSNLYLVIATLFTLEGCVFTENYINLSNKISYRANHHLIITFNIPFLLRIIVLFLLHTWLFIALRKYINPINKFNFLHRLIETTATTLGILANKRFCLLIFKQKLQKSFFLLSQNVATYKFKQSFY